MSQLPEAPAGTHSPLDPEAVRRSLSTGQFDDDTALKIVIQDAEKAEAFATSKQWVLNWQSANTLYQSPYAERYWEGTMVPKASMNLYTLATAVNSLTPMIVNGLFYEEPPFMAQERAGTTSGAVEAISDVLGYQLKEINFREQIRLGVLNCLLFGTNIWKYGWEQYKENRKVYHRKNQSSKLPSPVPGMPDITLDPEDEEIELEEVEETIDRPYFENVANLRYVLVDPGLNNPDIRKAKYVIERQYLTFDELDELRDRPGYNIPSRRDLLDLFLPPTEDPEASGTEMTDRAPMWDVRAEARWEKTTVDPYSQPLELLTRWDGKRTMAILQKKWVVCNDDNPYGEIPFLSVNWWDVPESFYGLGLGKLIGSEQRLQQGVTNAVLDQTTLALNGVFTRKRGKSVPTQSIRISPGRVIDVDDKDDIGVLPRPPLVPEAAQVLSMSQARAEAVSGSNEASTGVGGSTAHSNLGRTAAGANLIASGSGNRTSDFVDKLANQVIVPLLYKMHELNCALLPSKRLKYILNEELQSKFLMNGGDIVSILNARVLFDVLAGSKMQARRNMAQVLPILSQFLMNQEVTSHLSIQGKTIDLTEMLKMFFETSDWKNYYDVVRPMTPDELQRQQANSPAAMVQAKNAGNLQSQLTLEQQKSESKSDQIEQSALARAGADILRRAVETSGMDEAITGEPGSKGFGSES